MQKNKARKKVAKKNAFYFSPALICVTLQIIDQILKTAKIAILRKKVAKIPHETWEIEKQERSFYTMEI